MPTTVITYQHPYQTHQQIAVCERHGSRDPLHPLTAAVFGPLGPVQHGVHRGTCGICSYVESMAEAVEYRITDSTDALWSGMAHDIAVITRQALQDDPSATAEEIADIVREARADAAQARAEG